MNKKMVVIFFVILCTLLCIIPNNSYAASTTKITVKGIDRAPRIGWDRTNEKKFKIILKETSQISSVKLEKIENGKTTVLLNKDSNNSTKVSGIAISNDKKEIQINKTLLKDNEYTKFKITAYDSNSVKKNRIVSYFSVKKRKEKDSTRGWYEINNSPRIYYSDAFIITAKDAGKIESVTVKDRNNKNSVVKIGNQLSSSTEVEKSYKIDLTKLKEKNNRYFLTIIVKDKTGMSRSEEIIVKTEKVTTTTKKQTTSTSSSSSSSKATTSTSSSSSSSKATTSTSSSSSSSKATTSTSSRKTSTSNKGCNHSYGRTYEKATDANPCLVETYQICSKCGRKYVLSTKWQHSKIRSSTRNVGNCRQAINVYCGVCSRRLRSATIPNHHYVTETNYNIYYNGKRRTQYVVGCVSCGHIKSISYSK